MQHLVYPRPMTPRGKPRWSIVRGDWRLVQRRRGDEPIAFEGEPPPFLADAEVLETGRWGMRVSDGSWRVFQTKKAAEDYRIRHRHRQRALTMRHDWAERVEAQVRMALKAARKGTRVKVSTIYDNTLSSYLEPGRSADWKQPDPFIVYVFTESGRLRDPMSYADIGGMFDRAADKLRGDPWISDAGWESYNAAVQYFWVKPISAS